MSKIRTVQQHIHDEERLVPGATGDFTALLTSLILAAKIISRETNKAGLVKILGETDNVNVHGEVVMKLDEFAQETIYRAMGHGGHLCVMASEESEDIIPIPPGCKRGKYVLMFDPLDGSSNIDVNASIGTIFSIHRKITSHTEDGSLEDCLQKGTSQVAAGYFIYGSSTMMVYTTGHGVHGFTLDPSLGEFLLSHENIMTPPRAKMYSINEGNVSKWDAGTKRYIEYLKEDRKELGHPYSLRYIGSLVADFHRNLLKGGIFLYPGPKGKLRLLYEASPLAMVVEQAGGAASTGTERILDIEPGSLHQKVPLIIGSREDVAEYNQFYKEASSAAAD
ncbi:MAG: class 1 fructose-bisphosphatase [Acidobacteria bacterium]|nr:class 1 fructose-bisphosphatase [Acidobacteriota bacterium]